VAVALAMRRNSRRDDGMAVLRKSYNDHCCGVNASLTPSTMKSEPTARLRQRAKRPLCRVLAPVNPENQFVPPIFLRPNAGAIHAMRQHFPIPQ